MDHTAFDLEPDFVKKWVHPFYMTLFHPLKNEEVLTTSTKRVWGHLNGAVILRLLRQSEWRSRSCGAYFTGLSGSIAGQHRVEQLLLASELVYADGTYCLALAQLNNPSAILCLQRYIKAMTEKQSGYSHKEDAVIALECLGHSYDHNSSVTRTSEDEVGLSTAIDQYRETVASLSRIRHACLTTEV